jgi:hypothetical protein
MDERVCQEVILIWRSDTPFGVGVEVARSLLSSGTHRAGIIEYLFDENVHLSEKAIPILRDIDSLVKRGFAAPRVVRFAGTVSDEIPGFGFNLDWRLVEYLVSWGSEFEIRVLACS